MTYPNISIDKGSVAVIMIKRLHTNRLLIILICFVILVGGVGIFFWRTGRSSQVPPPDVYPVDAQTANLHKLAKVWGFAKYTHLAFLTGEKCWDEELLSLIPIIKIADTEDVNGILYGWFIGLGDDGYDLDYVAFRTILLTDFPDHEYIINNFFIDTNNHNWSHIDELHEELWYLNTGFEMNLRPMADLSWINEDYLGDSLFATLSRFHKIQVIDWDMAPVYFDEAGRSVFINKERFINIDYANCDNRLLGLFRLWNSVKYFFPYIDILDYDWNELLLTFIPKILEETNSFSYRVTLITMASKLQDAHVILYEASAADLLNLHFFGEQPEGTIRNLKNDVITSLFGSFNAPITLIEAEGYLVVGVIHRDIPEIELGDVILRINGTDIDDVTADMLRYLPYPNSEKALAFLVRDNAVLRQHSAASMTIDVYRFGQELSISFNTALSSYNNSIIRAASETHTIMENNIGLINPSRIVREESNGISALRNIFYEFENLDINGLIIDLRQYPSMYAFLIADYLLDETFHCFSMSKPFRSIPGVFIDFLRWYTGGGIHHAALYGNGQIGSMDRPSTSFFYNINTVVLINEQTQSRAESMVMTLRDGANVTVLGTNTIGANGDITFLPLPGGLTLVYTGLGVYLPDGGQTQRIGLSPDIYVPRTIEGIREGRDELMEAAIQFLLEQNSYNE